MRKKYCAYADRRGTYSIGVIGPMGSIRPKVDCRSFADFDEADQVARDIAAGKYPWLAGPGDYVNMR